MTWVWGSMGDWAMVVVTLGGLAFTATALFRGVADRRTEAVHGIALASVVAAEDPSTEEMLIKWELVNASSVAFDDVVIKVVDPCSSTPLVEWVIGTALPMRSKSGELKVTRPNGSLPFRWTTAPATLLYVDPWGGSWWRHAGPPQRLRLRPRVC